MSAPVALDSALLPQDGFHFLTTVNAREEGEQNERRLLVFEDTKSGGRIQELYGKLTELVGTLDKQVEVLLQDHEDDFFLAYKSHMHSVQNDFKALKKRADEEESKSRRDKKIQSLENELEWFTSEALRLDNVCKNYKKDVDKYRAQAQALEDDRKFLEEQIKACKRQNKLLRSAIEDSNSSANPVSPLSSVSRNFPGVLSSTEPATGSSQVIEWFSKRAVCLPSHIRRATVSRDWFIARMNIFSPRPSFWQRVSLEELHRSQLDHAPLQVRVDYIPAKYFDAVLLIPNNRYIEPY
eukprot:GHVT01032954.1.p1 GENE.GHVT01032954.1~~GHVT01032954.1.p1  ORF type:complete len:296 (-),score=15.48 GHVT01032954.1:588-1475(-)